MDKNIQAIHDKFDDFVAYFKGLKRRLPQRSLKVYVVLKSDRDGVELQSAWLDADRACEECAADKTYTTFVEEMEVEDYRG